MINQILTSSRNILNSFSFNGAARGNNALVTVKDLQNVIQNVNSQIFYRPVDFMLTNNGVANPTYKLLMSGAADCTNACNCAGDCGCPGPLSDPGGCTKESGAALIISVVRNGIGTYLVSFTPGHKDLINRGVAIWPAGLTNVAHRITISKMLGNVITIRTYDGAVLDDLILDETIFQMKLYVNK